MRSKAWALFSAAALLIPACATTTTSRTVWGDPSRPAQPMRQGRVDWIEETARHTEGHPVAGAAAGAAMGGLLGGLLTGRGVGALIGAAGGAMIGASGSQGSRDELAYDVAVRFDDGEHRVFRFRGYPPFQPGQVVLLTPRGLVGRASLAAAPPPPAAPPVQPGAESGAAVAQPSAPAPAAPPPPPAGTTPAPPQLQSRAQPPSVPDGEWAYTDEYGWVWMPYGAAYTVTPDYENGDPYMYVYYPSGGWTWVEAPWLWGWGPEPRFGVSAGVRYGWHGHGWGEHWRGHRPMGYRPVFGRWHH
jgi:outer membrane lipoprotein SlyB